MSKVSLYKISGFDIKLYCKVTESFVPNYKSSFAFGTAPKNFCLTACYDILKPTVIYIDRVEKNNLCVIDGKLTNYDRGTVKLVKVALLALKQFRPDIEKFTLFDDSQIYCEEGSKLFKLSMSFDYISKYNETWYQRQFGAELPGSKQDVNTMFGSYHESLRILDEPILDYILIIDRFPQFAELKNEYIASKTPRQFIHNLRSKLGNNFCFDVGKWLNQYMRFLQIKLYAEDWFITAQNVKDLPNFKIENVDNLNDPFRVRGGGKTKKVLRNKRRYRMISDLFFTESFVGGYDSQ